MYNVKVTISVFANSPECNDTTGDQAQGSSETKALKIYPIGDGYFDLILS